MQVKPPLVFSEKDVDILVAGIEEALEAAKQSGKF
jgi:4-aminobutyrate aminotransferase-like enzyme